jgi:acetylornithine/N-succinyldiaminopimelate aminotransferase
MFFGETAAVNAAIMTTYDRFDITVERGEGAYLFSTDGRRFLDFGSGVAVTALGHCHPHLVAALCEQTHRLWHCSNLYHIPGQQRLAARLTATCFADAAFFCNSGAEAMEGALKLARKYHDDNGQPQRYRVISCEGAFHGRTLATIAVGGSDKYRAGFEPTMEGFDRVPFGDLDAAAAAVTAETAAIVVEPIQGEGGIRPADPAYLQGLRALADAHGLLLLFDEVQSGMGRTGRLFAHQWTDVTPDIMAVAKGLGGGFPVGAVLATARAAAFTPGSHGSTFGGNPLAMAAGNAVLDVILADGFLDQVTATAATLAEALASMAGRFPAVVAEVRGQGLMLGLRCVVENRTLVGRLIHHGLLTIPAADNVVRLLPPLIIGQQQIDEAMAILDLACAELCDKAA